MKLLTSSGIAIFCDLFGLRGGCAITDKFILAHYNNGFYFVKKMMSDSELMGTPELGDEQEDFQAKEADYQQRLEILEHENAQLKSQVSQVEVYASKLEKLQGDILALRAENGDYKNKIADLEHRLEFVNDEKSEIQEELDKERQRHEHARSQEYAGMNENFDKQRAEYMDQINQLKQAIQERDEKLSQSEIQAKLVKSNTDRLLQTAERFFEISIPSVEELIRTLEQPPQPAPVAQRSPTKLGNTTTRSPVKTQVPQPQAPSVDEQVLKRLKQKNTALKTKCRELQEENEIAVDEAKKAERNYQKEIKSLKNQLEANKSQTDLERNRMTKQISNLQSQLDTLSELKSRNQTEIVAPLTRGLNSVMPIHEQPKYSPAPQARSLIEQPDGEKEQIKKILENQEKKIESLQKEIRDRVSQAEAQLEDETRKEEALTEKLQAAEAELSSAIAENKELKRKIDSLSIVNGQLKEQVETYRAALTASKPEEPVKVTPPPPNYKADIKKLNNEIDGLNKKLIENQAKINEQENAIVTLKKEIEQQTKRAEAAEENGRQLSMDLRESEAKIQNLPKPKPSEILPPEAWHSNGWSSELAAAIDRIASNHALQPTSKLQHVFAEIQTYYKQILEQKEKSLVELQKESEAIRKKVNDFLVDASIALSGSSVTFDEFIKSDAGKEIVAKITQLRNENNDLKVENDQQYAIIEHLNESLMFELDQYEPQVIISKIDEIRQNIDLQTQQFEATRKKAIRYKRNLEDLKASTGNLIKQLNEENTKLVDENQELNETLETVKKELEESKEMNETLNNQMEETITQREITSVNEKDQSDKIIESIHEEYAQREEEINTELSKVRGQLDSVSSQLETEEAKSAELTEELQKAQDEIKNATAMLVKANEESEKKLVSSEERHESEKKTMEEEFNNTVEELKSQNKTLQSDIETISSKLASNETKIKTLRQRVLKLQEERSRNVEESKRAAAQMEREKLLLDAQARTRILEEQAQMNTKMLELQSSHEGEKKRIFNTFADKFRKFCNPLKSLDEREYKASVERAFDEYSRLSQADVTIRRMLSAQDKQTTEDAVAQMLVLRN